MTKPRLSIPGLFLAISLLFAGMAVFAYLTGNVGMRDSAIGFFAFNIVVAIVMRFWLRARN